ncbi:Z-ring formation inhibitor MciZ [Bacillus salacetis]|uniref:Z-ring formation inhibitor MciZ n=1 Tax=Bacillus salacetis TaxID=2315464 RepID=A0A3A1R2I8_9BACI|nr:Z-ring formation inhibitor MciZ [Bacillus salacetis]RIW33583.1 Z-ring formation inhibitor MciZ [Bacillus salacetis]
MKIIVHPKGVILHGKAWEIKAKLKEYSHKYQYIQDWSKAASNEKQ